ncbi:MAG: class I SAM-dependent methyltransferase [Nitrospiraceae bacterium]
MNVTQDQVEAGQAVYGKGLLAVYDLGVLGFSNQFVWKCPSRRMLALYNQHVSANHLDVGVGTGYFLDHCRFPSETPRLALLDLNPNCLDATSRRVARYKPEVYRANVLEPIEDNIPRFESVGMNYLLHCLPGTIRSKAVVFKHLKALLTPRGILFGSTLLMGGVERNWLARRLMARYNAYRVFTNTHDDLEGLRWALSQHLSDISVEVVGCAALFSGRV